MLGTYLGSSLQGNRASWVLETVVKCGVDIRPAAMGVTWDDVEATLASLPEFVEENDYMFTIANISKDLITPAWLEQVKREVEEACSRAFDKA